MNYELMSDFEINKAVATAWLSCDYDFNEKEKTVDLVGYVTYLGGHGIPDERLEKYGEFSPCNNASDAWAIIAENGISVVFMGGEWECHALVNNDESFNTKHKNLRRAAMIVFLMMQND
jgi:hypothetical protein